MSASGLSPFLEVVPRSTTGCGRPPRPRVVKPLLVSLLGALLLCTSAHAQDSWYVAALDGSNVVPPNSSQAVGYGIVRVQEPANNVKVFVHWAGLSGAPTSAHLHLGPGGANGQILLPLMPEPMGDAWTGLVSLSSSETALVKTGGAYLDVHTAAFPGGEIRGQIVASLSTRFTAVLTGASQVPPNASSATGAVVAFLHEPDNRLVYAVETGGLASGTGAALHAQQAGANGPVVFALNGGAGAWCGVSDRLSAQQVAALRNGGTYVNVASAAFPSGELRGQLVADAGDEWVALLDGAQMVPSVTTGALGQGCVQIDAHGVATVRVSHGALIQTATAVELHQGARGSNGALLLALTAAGPGRFVGTFMPSGSQLAQLRQGNWYVDVHTPANGGGEIRGQLVRGVRASTFGPGCPGSNGVRPEIGSTGIACLGTSFTVDLYGARPQVPVVLQLGLARTAAGGRALPLWYEILGYPAPCYLLTQQAVNRLAFTDARGCASLRTDLPFVPGYRGTEIYAQWGALDIGANPAGFVVSNGLVVPVQ